jgi:hypothetical protein
VRSFASAIPHLFCGCYDWQSVLQSDDANMVHHLSVFKAQSRVYLDFNRLDTASRVKFLESNDSKTKRRAVQARRLASKLKAADFIRLGGFY